MIRRTRASCRNRGKPHSSFLTLRFTLQTDTRIQFDRLARPSCKSLAAIPFSGKFLELPTNYAEFVFVPGRVHSAVVSGINWEQRTVTVEWFERGETKGKEVLRVRTSETCSTRDVSNVFVVCFAFRSRWTRSSP